ncbi:tRNA A37 N6-isopentenylltransferase MiaA (MiaA) (PDB:2ZM5) [Commensalibacter communis]|uniref:tRNA (adenosine(37)-N6)-dimethylallyltransferase MiaA n=1 Tax=Commensalibacter communis TaxID=2972786 RepID=UPI0022FFC2BA|nr:tRNA (adenosine(37)-N6)-dimethylallyltransferase MiaA [Commensalibacter communis]CAI3931680.1 tRNA A37 N6-isopentenylltransferase MiaA (MiaA) (PDB:2ZM5) [Commensalibacter communis]
MMLRSSDNTQKPWAIIVAGPTCSGKSYLSLKIAEALQGTIINADAMQCYRDLRIITTRPSIEDEACVPHRLYGVLPWDQTGNAGWWREQAISELNQAWDQQKLPILCGGTGMYFHSLIHGIAMIPEPSAEAREEARQLIETKGAPFLHESLLQVDPQTAELLNPADSQRIARAWEVWRSTGKGLKYWQQEAHIPGIDCRFLVIRLAPDRALLKEAVAQRFIAMVDEGAVEEVEEFLRANPPVQAPLRRALGVPEFAAYLSGELLLSDAIDQAVRNTQRYIKRQETWFSHRILAPEDQICIFNSRIDKNLKFSESFIEKSILFINSFIDV